MRAPGVPPLCGGEGGGGRARSQGGGEGGESGPPGPRFNPRDSGGEAVLTQAPSPFELVEGVGARYPVELSTDGERGVYVQCMLAPTAKAGTGGSGWGGGVVTMGGPGAGGVARSDRRRIFGHGNRVL